eukprot:2076268-Amphidinium_carterae.1
MGAANFNAFVALLLVAVVGAQVDELRATSMFQDSWHIQFCSVPAVCVTLAEDAVSSTETTPRDGTAFAGQHHCISGFSLSPIPVLFARFGHSIRISHSLRSSPVSLKVVGMLHLQELQGSEATVVVCLTTTHPTMLAQAPARAAVACTVVFYHEARRTREGS